MPKCLYRPVIPTLRRLKQEDCHKLEADFVFNAIPKQSKLHSVIYINNKKISLAVEVHVCNPNTQKVEAGGLP